MATAERASFKIRRGDRLPLLAVILTGVSAADLEETPTCTFQLYPQSGETPVTQAGTLDAPTVTATLEWDAASTAVADLYEGWVAWNSETAKPGTFGPFTVLIYDPAEV